MSDDLQSHLQAYCARAFPDRQDMQIRDLVSITAGWENEMYAFDVEYGPAGERRREKLVLRVYPGDDAYVKSAHEFQGMRQLYQAGYPVPQVLLLERESSHKPFVIMERIDGQVLWPILFDASEKKRRELLTRFCALFVQLHTLDWRPFAEDVARYATGGPYFFIDQWLSIAHDFLRRFSRPGFLPIGEWLEARREQVPCLRPSLVHGDFHPGNLLLRDDGLAVVIDWSQLNISDFRFDLAWTLLLVGSYEGVKWRNRILHEYERLAGAGVEQIEFFEVFACTRRLFDLVVSLSEGAERLGMRPGAIAMMKRQMGAFHSVYSLLLERTGIRVAEVEQLLATHS